MIVENDLGLDTSAVDMLHGGLAHDEQQRSVEAFKHRAAQRAYRPVRPESPAPDHRAVLDPSSERFADEVRQH